MTSYSCSPWLSPEDRSTNRDQFCNEEDFIIAHSGWALINNGDFIRFITDARQGNTPLLFPSCLKWGYLRGSWWKRNLGKEKTKGRHNNYLWISKGWPACGRGAGSQRSEGEKVAGFQVIIPWYSLPWEVRLVPHAGEIQAEAMGLFVMDIPQGSLLIRPLWSFLQSWSLVRSPISSMSLLCVAWTGFNQDTLDWRA